MSLVYVLGAKKLFYVPNSKVVIIIMCKDNLWRSILVFRHLRFHKIFLEYSYLPQICDIYMVQKSQKYFVKTKVHQNKDARSERILNHCDHLLKVLLESPLNLPARCIVFVWPRCKVVLEKCVCFKGNSHNALQN